MRFSSAGVHWHNLLRQGTSSTWCCISQALSLVLLLLGCMVLAPIALNIDWRDPYNGRVVPMYLIMTVAALVALAVDAGFAVVVFCMGAIGDATQANVLSQSLSQLKLMDGLTKQ